MKKVRQDTGELRLLRGKRYIMYLLYPCLMKLIGETESAISSVFVDFMNSAPTGGSISWFSSLLSSSINIMSESIVWTTCSESLVAAYTQIQ